MIRATTATRRTIRHAHWLLALLLLLTATALAAPTGSPLAWADTAPTDPSEPQTVSSDSLPTAQIDGVAWSQQVSGNVVFVGGSFANARPAGSAPGVNTVARPNLMSYDLTNGVMTSWAPNLNGQVRSLAVSPDGNTLYVAGQFTSINGLARYRLAAFDISTPALKLDPALKPWAPNVNATVYGIYATASTLYFGGPFSSVNGTARAGAAAINPTTNALTGFAPTMAGGSVREVIVSPDGTKVVLGGNFTSTNGTGTPSGYGLALLDTATGASLPMPVNSLIRNAGANAAIMSLAVAPDGQSLYGTGYSYQKTTGNLEGAFKADWSGNLIWVEDCHGDSYSIFPMRRRALRRRSLPLLRQRRRLPADQSDLDLPARPGLHRGDHARRHHREGPVRLLQLRGSAATDPAELVPRPGGRYLHGPVAGRLERRRQRRLPRGGW